MAGPNVETLTHSRQVYRRKHSWLLLYFEFDEAQKSLTMKIAKGKPKNSKGKVATFITETQTIDVSSLKDTSIFRINKAITDVVERKVNELTLEYGSKNKIEELQGELKEYMD
jgi:hypothetical protein